MLMSTEQPNQYLECTLLAACGVSRPIVKYAPARNAPSPG
jgi:hypothetical protein